jgi:hypothetical protein
MSDLPTDDSEQKSVVYDNMINSLCRPTTSLQDLRCFTNENVSLEYVMKNHFKFTDKDYKDYVKMLKRDAKLRWQLSQIEANGKIPKNDDLS